jgi:hypothetical protein
MRGTRFARKRFSSVIPCLIRDEKRRDILRMIVLILAMRLMILALTLASGPVPKAGS